MTKKVGMCELKNVYLDIRMDERDVHGESL